MSTATELSTSVPAWVDEVTDDLEAEFGAGTAQRGRRYAAEGRVTRLIADPTGQVLVATVIGSGRARYQTTIRVEWHHGELLWATRCSCPVGMDCKHVVAVLLEAARRREAAPQRRQESWERLLAPLATLASPPSTTTAAGLMLLWPGGSALPAPGQRVELRPVRRGASGRWVKSDMSWSAVSYARDLTSGAREAYGAIRSTALAGRGRLAYGETTHHLCDLGQNAARLLRDAVRAGITLVAPDQRGRVLVHDELASPRVDVRRDAHGDLRLTTAWSLPDRDWPADQVRLLGDPPATLLTATATTGAGAIAGRDLLIAGAGAVDEQLLPLLRAGSLRIPAEDAPRFVATYYPVLRRRVEVVSGDDSCPPPPEVSARLRMRAQYTHGHRLAVEWKFSYGDGDRATVFPVAGGGPRLATTADAVAQALRQPDQEARLLSDAVAILASHLPDLITATGWGGPLASPVAVAGLDTAVFTTQVLPALQAHPDIDVDIVGRPADYRHVAQAPEVRLGIAEDAGGGTDWFDLEVRVDLDGEEVPFRSLFAALAQGEQRFLLDSGAWFDLDRPELARLRRLIEEARALSEPDGPLRLSRWQAGLWDELTELGVVETQCMAWTQAVAGLLDPDAMAPVAPPDDLDATLRGYQVDGYQWLNYLWTHRLGGILADDMGLGKTVQALAAILKARQADAHSAAGGGSGEQSPPVLVIAPTSVIGTWVGEAAKFAPSLRVVAVTETAKRRGYDLAVARASADVVVTSYALVRLEQDDYGAVPWAGVLLDEAQFVKNPRGRTHHVVRSLDAPVKIAMTGTPMENSLMDLWALLAITAPGLFPRQEAFTEQFRRPIESGTDPDALARLQRRVRPLMLRRTKELVAPELPPKQEQVVRVTLAPAHRQAYDRQLQRERQRVLGLLTDFRKNRIAIFSSLTLLRQLALAPALIDPDGPGAAVPAAKIEAFVERIAQVAAEGHRALVFSQFTGFLALVRARLEKEGVEYAYLDGRTRDRAARIATWRGGSAPVFLISLKAGGFGVTLTEADYVFVLDPWWNPAAEAQAVDRTHRIGQDKTVMVYRLIAADTIEEKVLALQERKRELFTRVVDSGGAVDGMLTADDIRGLLQEA